MLLILIKSCVFDNQTFGGLLLLGCSRSAENQTRLLCQRDGRDRAEICRSTGNDLWGITTEHTKDSIRVYDLWGNTKEHTKDSIRVYDLWGNTEEHTKDSISVYDLWGNTEEHTKDSIRIYEVIQRSIQRIQ